MAMEVIHEGQGVPKPVGPYSPAVKLGELVFCSGQIGLNPQGDALVEGLEAQTRQVLQNLTAVLSAAGSSPSKIVMTSIFLSDIADGALVNKLYEDFVSQDSPPARQTIAVKALPLGALVEISVIASV